MWGIVLLCVVPISDGVLRESTDVCELNRVTCGERIVLTQLIWWAQPKTQWEKKEACIDFRVVSDASKYSIERRGTGCVVRWRDGDKLREVSSQSFRESWTETDVEIEARTWLPKDDRKGLRKR